MDSKELAKKVYNDLMAAPEQLSKLQNELMAFVDSVKRPLEVVIVGNIKEVIKIQTEDEFFNFIAHLLDMAIPLPPVAEQVDYYVFKWLLKGFVDKILDKFAGDDWLTKFNNWLDHIILKNNMSVSAIRDSVNA